MQNRSQIGLDDEKTIAIRTLPKPRRCIPITYVIGMQRRGFGSVRIAMVFSSSNPI